MIFYSWVWSQVVYNGHLTLMENNIGNDICCAKRIQLYLYQATDCVMADGWCIAVNVFP